MADAAAVKKAFSDLKKRPVEQTPAVTEPARTEQVRKTVKRNTKLDYLAIAFPAPSIKDRPDIYAMDVLSSYLGGSYISWLESDLKGQQRLAVDASSDYLTQKDQGLIILTITTEPDKADAAEKAVFDKIANLRKNPISPYDLSRAIRSLAGISAFDTETFSGRAANLGYYEALDNFELARSYIKNISSVTSEDVLAAARKYLDPSKAVIVTVGP